MLIFYEIPGCSLPVKSARRRKSSLLAAVEGTTTVPSDCEGEKLSFSGSSEPAVINDDENDGVDDGKMARVCDKLIDVFMVDKPTPNDWRKLLAFSKEWNNLRPHFYKRSQERADSEDDPGKKHNLLKFARKFKDVGLVFNEACSYVNSLFYLAGNAISFLIVFVFWYGLICEFCFDRLMKICKDIMNFLE